MKKTATLLMFIAIISKALGFGRELVLSYFYGASNITDAYLISMTIPSVIFDFIGVAIATSFIPIYSKIEQFQGDKKANKYTNNLVNALLVLCTILFILGVIFTMPLVKVFAAGFEGETLDLAVKFTRIGLAGIYFTTMVHLFKSFLQIKSNYAVPALVGVPLNFFTILFIILSSGGNPTFLAIGTVVAAISQFLFMLPFIYKKGYRYKPRLNIKDEHIKQMIYLALPVVFGLSVNKINILVDRTIASTIAQGGITALNYATKIRGVVQDIFVMSIATALYPMISKMAAENNVKGLIESVSEAISGVSLLVVPATIGAMIFAQPIVTLLFGRGQFDAKALAMTSTALFFYSLGMIGIGFREVLSRAFYSMQDTRTPAINAAIAMILNIVLNIVLSRFMGLGGLALATSIAALVGTFLLFVSLRKKIGAFGMKDITISFVKILGASLVMGLIAKLAFNGINAHASQNLALIAAIGVGAVVYGVMIYFMKIEEVDVLIEMVKGKIRKV